MASMQYYHVAGSASACAITNSAGAWRRAAWTLVPSCALSHLLALPWFFIYRLSCLNKFSDAVRTIPCRILFYVPPLRQMFYDCTYPLALIRFYFIWLGLMYNN